MLKFITQLSTVALLLVFAVSLSAQDAPSAAKLYNEALGKMKEKSYEEAFPLFEQALSTADSTSENGKKVISLANRNGASCAYRLGTADRKAKDLEKAMEYFDKGITMNPDYTGNYVGRAQTVCNLHYTVAASQYMIFAIRGV